MLLTMEEIKAQLRLDEDFDADDRHLQLLACAAQKRTETYLNGSSMHRMKPFRTAIRTGCTCRMIFVWGC
ncbi:phage protein [Escherichia coli]|nr:phage protein [Escherichia coli]